MVSRDIPALKPALYGRVVGMTQLACEGADTAALADKLCVIHTQRVHPTRTHVNVDCVRPSEDKVYVPNEETTGEALARLRTRSGLSMRAFALASGYSHASGVQRYVDAGFTKRLDLDVATKMADALEGHGDPAITRAEVMALTGLPIESNALPFRMEGAGERRMTHDVPVYGTALGADEIVDGEAIEQTTLNQAEVIGYIRRPVLLDGRADVYGLYVQGSSMAPRYRDGATLFVERKKPPRIGDDVVVYLRSPDDHDGERPSCVLIKTLVRKTASYIELEQYTPALQFRIPVERVGQMDRVLTLDELVA